MEITCVSSASSNQTLSLLLIKITASLVYLLLYIFARCNNVLYIRGVEDEDEEGEMRE